MEANKSLVRAGYLLSLMLIVIPLVDLTTTVWPLRLGQERWRFGALGSLSNGTLIPLLGLFTALGIAVLANHPRTRRVIGWICALFAVAAAAFTVLFVLDYFQTRTIVVPQFQHTMAVATTGAIVKYIVTIILLTFISRAGLSGPRKITRVAKPLKVETTASPLLSLGRTTRPE